MGRPLVSIVMPVFNAGDYLPLAIGSMIEQTFADWELICVNDGSSDKSPKVLEWFARQDGRIRVVHQANMGIVAALNRGLEMAAAPLIARMDADDISLPDRLEKQVQFLEAHPQVVVAGSAALEVDADGDPLKITRLPSDPRRLVERLLHRETAVMHPSVMLRAAAIRQCGGYRAQFQWVEDHDLWLRMSRVGELSNLDEVLLCYRQHGESVCWQKGDRQRVLMNELLTEAYAERGLPMPPECLVEASTVRTAAGPGKWARLAVRGGFFRSAMKHLGRQWTSSPASWYTLRMTGEVLCRGLAGVASSRRVSRSPRVPVLSHWQSAYREGGERGKRKAA